MALDAIVDSVDAMDESLKAQYKPITTEGDNKGKFMLDVNASHGYSLDNVVGLQTSFTAKSAELDRATAALAGFNGLKLKPSDIAALVKEHATLKAFDPETEADRRAQTKLQGFQAQITTEFEGKFTSERERNTKLTGQVEKLLITNALTKAISDHGGVPGLLLPVLASRVKVKEDETGDLQTHVLDEKGQADLTFVDGRVVPSTIDDLVKKFKADPMFGRAFDASGKTGTGAPVKVAGAQNNGAATSLTRTQWIDKTARATTAERTALLKDAAAGKYIIT